MDDRALVERADFHLKIVQEISELVNQSRGLDNILKDIANKIGDSLHFDVVSIYLWDKQGGKLVLRSTRGLKVNLDYPIRLKPDEGLTGLVYETRRSLVVMPASQHPRYKYFSDIGEEEYESYIGVPILLQNRCLGVLVGQTKERRLINPAEETLFQIIASRLAGLLEVADRLERLQSPSIIKPETRTYQGKGVSGGFAVGTVYISRGLSQEISLDELKSYSVEGEISRLTDAFTRVDKDLYSLIQALEEEGVLSKSEISIFETHLLILNGSTFRNAIVGKVKEKGIAAEPAVIEGIESIAGQFENLNDPYLRERAQDFHDLGEKILYYLLRSRGLEKGFQQPREDSIVVAYDIGPSFLTMLHRSKIAAIVAEKGGETSHTAILAKSLGIPAVVGIKNICNLVKSGEELLVDGKTGFIFSNPDRDLVLEYENTHNKLVRLEEIIEKEEADPGNALLPVTITANIGFPVDVDMAKQHRLNDVGLFRTEFAFAQYSRWPGVEEQIKIYEDIGKHFEGYITIRTLDIGADKLLPYFSFPREENPLLGLRAIRFSMEYLDLFRDQIRAVLLTVKNGYRFRILLPMVSSVWEVETAREIVEQLGNEIGVPFSDLPPLGIMLEVPAVLHQLDDYKDMIDFVSVGTNDLVQYLLAVDRNSSTVGHLYSGFHPAVLRALSDTYLKANSLGKEITVCGEMAGTPLGALALVSLGYTQLSILPSRAPVIRHLCKQISEDYLHDVKLKILNEKNERRVERYLNEALESLDPILIEID